MKLIRLLKQIRAVITLYHISNKHFKLRIAPVALVVTDVSRLLRLSWRAVSRLLYGMRNIARHDFFLYQNTWARQRVVTWRNEWILDWSGKYEYQSIKVL